MVALSEWVYEVRYNQEERDTLIFLVQGSEPSAVNSVLVENRVAALVETPSECIIHIMWREPGY